MNYKTKELMDVIKLSEMMLKDAEVGNWESVFAAESKRNDILNELFSLPFSKKDKEENNEIIQQVLVINKKLESVTAQARDEIKKEFSSINKGRHAVGVYAQNTG